jgi:hypothetical protein
MMAASLALPRAACVLSTAILPASPERRSPQPGPHRSGHETAIGGYGPILRRRFQGGQSNGIEPALDG